MMDPIAKSSRQSLQPWIGIEYPLQQGLGRFVFLLFAHALTGFQLFLSYTFLPFALLLLLVILVLVSAFYYLTIEWRLRPVSVLFDGVYWQFRYRQRLSKTPLIEKVLGWLFSYLRQSCLIRLPFKNRLNLQLCSHNVVRAKLLRERSTFYSKVLFLSFESVANVRLSADIWWDQLPAAEGFRRLSVVARLR